MRKWPPLPRPLLHPPSRCFGAARRRRGKDFSNTPKDLERRMLHMGLGTHAAAHEQSEGGRENSRPEKRKAESE